MNFEVAWSYYALEMAGPTILTFETLCPRLTEGREKQEGGVELFSQTIKSFGVSTHTI